MITQGKWEIVHEFNVRCGNRSTASCGGYSTNKFQDTTRQENIDNAQIICTAINACQEVSKDNPQAVAEAIPAAFEALRKICLEHSNFVFEELAESLGNTNTRILKEAVEQGNKVLRQAGVIK